MRLPWNTQLSIWNRIPTCKLKLFILEAEVKVFMMLRTMCRGQKGKILRQYIIKSPFISLFCNEGRRQCCCYFFSLFVENVATSKKQKKNCSRISFSLYNYFYGKVRPCFVQTKDPWELKRLFLVWWIFKILWGTWLNFYTSCSPLTRYLLHTSVSANIISRTKVLSK